MGHAITGGSAPDEKSTTSKLSRAILVEDIKVVERELIVDVPRINYKEVEKVIEVPVFKEVPTLKYVVNELPTTRYNETVVPTTKYVTTEVPTTKYNVQTEATTKYVPKEVIVEKPIIHEKPLEVITIKDLELVKEYTKAITELSKTLPALLSQLKELKDYKLIQELIKVPKLEWITTPVERIEWVSVKVKKDM